MHLSVITINYNNALNLERTIGSLAAQSENKFELIIIDGGSNDGSIEFIEKYEKNVSYWISEKDAGIYDAMNKGITRAHGDYLMFLNSGDYLSDEYALQNCYKYILASPSVDIFYGDIFGVKKGVTKKWVHTHPEQLDLLFWQNSNINHQSALIKATLFDEFGSYPSTYKLAGDHWFFLKCFINNKKFMRIPLPLVTYDYSGSSSLNRFNYVNEMEQIWKEVLPVHLQDLVAQYRRQEKLMNNKIVKRAIKLSNYYQVIKKIFKKK